ncbi:SPFH domain-containing protein [Candidatus Methanodesulfokora washburnensis]|jgi:membrane protease subunit (stomatin/prohibitin family)|uniref:SPFH domain-containing protein n=1 Tax=Candidatus Methanodesulfokora washburnensis TaxID=2478471 RepID=A0A429GWF7_9CREN|nr:SPFH domain-containing protein [Candidatus Methanodesulfokores washburnensis]RSN78061.1 SPFH domain-containing protein [Candidatus Methanodesulfokores washburnensis]
MSKTNVIEWTNAGPDDILWVYPYEDIRWGSVVVVHEYETAVFMRDGKVYDVLNPGRHTITTQNIPLLTRAYRLVMGYGETPFKATIVFISLKQFRGRFGISSRVRISPNALYTTELQAFGDYWFRVADPVLFLTQIAGAVKSLTTQDVSNFIRSFLSELLMQELSKRSATDVYTNLEEVTRRIKADVVAEAFAQRGLELIDLKMGGVSLPLLEKMEKEDPTYGLPLLIAIQKGEEDQVLQIVKTVESMRALGKSPGAGIMGALFAIPQMLGAQPAQPAQPSQPAQPTQPAQKSYADRLRELKKMLDDGLITQEDYDRVKKQILDEMSRG